MIDAGKAGEAALQQFVHLSLFRGMHVRIGKIGPRVFLAAKLIANMITSAGADRIMTCDLHAWTIKVFSIIPLDSFENGSAIFVPLFESLRLEILIFCSSRLWEECQSKGLRQAFLK